MSLGFEVEEIVTLIESGQGGGNVAHAGIVPLLVAGTPAEESNGDAVFAPLIPQTCKAMNELPESVTVIVSPERAGEATAHHSFISPTVNGVDFLSVKLRCP
jgi:hypothetical protein